MAEEEEEESQVTMTKTKVDSRAANIFFCVSPQKKFCLGVAAFMLIGSGALPLVGESLSQKLLFERCFPIAVKDNKFVVYISRVSRRENIRRLVSVDCPALSQQRLTLT